MSILSIWNGQNKMNIVWVEGFSKLAEWALLAQMIQSTNENLSCSDSKIQIKFATNIMQTKKKFVKC